MKKLRLILVTFGLLLTIISSGQTLSYRLANPTIAYAAGVGSYLSFDLEVIASAPGSFLWAGQANLNFNSAVLSSLADDWSAVPKGTLLSGNFPNPIALTGVKYTVFVGTVVGNVFNLAFAANSALLSKAANATYFNEVSSVNWQPIATITGKIADQSAGAAGISFVQTSMNGQQYQHASASVNTPYTTPNGYSSDLSNLYVGRIYSVIGGWTQVGEASVNWATSVRTSVWDGDAVTADATLANASWLRVHTGGKLTIPANGKMTVTNATDIVSASGLSILSDVATGNTGSFITGTSAGTAEVQRSMTGATLWHLISAPVEGQNIQAFVGNGQNNIALNGALGKYGLATWNTSGPAWVHYTAASLPTALDFVSGKGYEVLRGDAGLVRFTGTVATGTVPFPVANGATNLWWNLLGNPYTASMNANSSAGATNFLTTNMALLESGYKAIYVWNAAANHFDVINDAPGAAYVAVGQGFFVKPVAGGGTASMTAGMRTHQNAAPFKGVQSEVPTIILNGVIAGNSWNAKVYYMPGMTQGIDEGYDAGIFEDNNPDVALSTHMSASDIDFAIQCLPENDFETNAVAVGLNALNGSSVIFTADVTNFPANTKVYLEDKVTGKFTRLDESGSSYTVNLTADSKGTGRFYLHTTQGTMGVDENVLSDITVIALPREHKIRILGTSTPNAMATTYEMNGAVVGTKVLPNVGENEMPFTPVSNGIYLLKVQQTGSAAPTSVKINWIY